MVVNEGAMETREIESAYVCVEMGNDLVGVGESGVIDIAASGQCNQWLMLESDNRQKKRQTCKVRLMLSGK